MPKDGPLSSVSLLGLWEMFSWGLADSTLGWQAHQTHSVPVWGLGCSQPAGSPLSQVKSPDGEDGNKTEAQLFWVFSRPSNSPIPLFLSFFSELQTVLFSGICFRDPCASKSLNLFQVGCLLLSSPSGSLASSAALALLSLSPPESFTHSLLSFSYKF